jgi:uncharacterized protein (TIGR02569 family)
VNGDIEAALHHVVVPPPDQVQADFQAAGTVSKLPGGRGTAWKAGHVTLKPLDVLPEELLWLDEVARRHVGGSRLRLSLPIRSQSEKLIMDGWTAFPYLAGEHRTGRWLEIANIAREFAAIFSGVQRPAFLDMRTHAWASADRFAWSEGHTDPPVDAPYVGDLVNARRPVSDPPTLVHGDMTGNVLFDSDLPPAVIDLTLYWRPVEYSVAIIAIDAVCFEGAPLSLLETISPNQAFPHYLIRAALFRIVTDHLKGRRASDYNPYNDAVNRVLQLVTDQRHD